LRRRHGEKSLADEEAKALVGGNYNGSIMTLDKLKDELVVAQGYLEHILNKLKLEGTE
jgi:hypothetical protein